MTADQLLTEIHRRAVLGRRLDPWGELSAIERLVADWRAQNTPAAASAAELDIPAVPDTPRRCTARQYSDQMHCVECGLTWDTNDMDPPACLGRRTP
jgi:hypothetical protein